MGFVPRGKAAPKEKKRQAGNFIVSKCDDGVITVRSVSGNFSLSLDMSASVWGILDDFIVSGVSSDYVSSWISNAFLFSTMAITPDNLLELAKIGYKNVEDLAEIINPERNDEAALEDTKKLYEEMQEYDKVSD